MSATNTQKGIQTAKEKQDILLPKKAGSIHKDTKVFNDEERLKRLLDLMKREVLCFKLITINHSKDSSYQA